MRNRNDEILLVKLEKEERYMANTTTGAYDLLIELMQSGESSSSGDYYHWGRMPSAYDLDKLLTFYREGETRVHTDDENERYVVQRWHDGSWVDLC